MHTSIEIDSDLVVYIDQYVHCRGDFGAVFAQMAKIGGICYDDYVGIMNGGGGEHHPHYERTEPARPPLTPEQESKIRIAIMLSNAFTIKNNVRFSRCMKSLVFEEAQYDVFKADAKKHNMNICTYMNHRCFIGACVMQSYRQIFDDPKIVENLGDMKRLLDYMKYLNDLFDRVDTTDRRRSVKVGTYLGLDIEALRMIEAKKIYSLAKKNTQKIKHGSDL